MSTYLYRSQGRRHKVAAALGILLSLTLIALIPAAGWASQPDPEPQPTNGVIALPQTGQTISYYPGDDGDVRAGIAWPNPRFTNNGDGTVTDQLTGLMWTADGGTPTVGSCTGGALGWAAALDYVACLNQNSYQGYTDWRLANALEFDSLLSHQPYEWLQSQGFTNSSWGGWTSTLVANRAERFWSVQMFGLHPFSATMATSSRPVRTHNPAPPAPLWQTGQTTSAAAGDDGDVRAGIAWPDPRFTNNGDGTVTDNLTGLMWLRDANCLMTTYPSFDQDVTPGDGAVLWKHALDFVTGINAGTYAGCGSNYYDWHLANRKELLSLIDFSQSDPALPSGHPFLNVQHAAAPNARFYWTSTTTGAPYGSDSAYLLFFHDGTTANFGAKATQNHYVWPVRLAEPVPPEPDDCDASPLPITSGNSWRFFKGRAAPPAGWNGVDFDAVTWPTSPTPFGYGGTYDLTAGTVLTDMQRIVDTQLGYISLFIRREFCVDDPAALGALYLSVDFDDGYIAYLNGELIEQTNLNSAAYSAAATADHPAGVPAVTSIDPASLQPGKNVLALQGHNLKKTSSDFYLNAALTTSPPDNPVPTLPIHLGDTWKYFPGTANPAAGWNTAGFDDNDWLAGPTGIGYGNNKYNTAGHNTLLTENTISVYARKKFRLDSLPDNKILQLAMDYDDGFIAYLNGVQVARQYVPEPAAYNTPANPPGSNHQAGDYEYFVLNQSMLQTGTNVLAIQVHNVSLISSDLFLWPELAWVDVADPGEPAPPEHGPYLQNATPNSIVVMWRTATNTVGKVRHRLPGAAAWTETPATASAKNHSVTISGLAPGVAREYQVDTDGTGQWYPATPARLAAAPAAAAGFRAVVYGDTRGNVTDHTAVVNQIIGHDPDIVLLTGDLVNVGSRLAQWTNTFFGPARSLMMTTPYYPSLGNHEYRSGDSELTVPDPDPDPNYVPVPPTAIPSTYATLFTLPDNGAAADHKERWYAFSYGCARVVVLDTNRGEFAEVYNKANPTYGLGTPQYTWLLDELQSDAFQNAAWQIIVQHHPGYTTTRTTDDPSDPDYEYDRHNHGHPPDEQVQNVLSPLFKQYGVDMVFTAHNHRYEHALVNGIHYFNSAGGGAPFYPCGGKPWEWNDICVPDTHYFIAFDVVCGTGSALTVKVIDKEGTPIDSRTITQNVRIAQGSVLALSDDTTVKGDWINDGFFIHNWFPVAFSGADPQAIGGTAPTNFYDLIIDGGATVDIPTANVPTVEGQLTNRGTLRQTRDAAAGESVDFLNINDSYRGLQLTAADGSLGPTTVSISGGQVCPAAAALGRPPVARCYTIEPAARTASPTATIRFFYLAGSELNGNNPQTLMVYRQTAEGWAMLTDGIARESDGGLYDWVQVRSAEPFGRFALGNHVGVVIDSFTATNLPQGVAVSWQTAAEPFGKEFVLWRAAAEAGPYDRLTAEPIPATGQPAAGAVYTYIDEAAAGSAWFYKLEHIDLYGQSILFGPVGVGEGSRLYLPLTAR